MALANDVGHAGRPVALLRPALHPHSLLLLLSCLLLVNQAHWLPVVDTNTLHKLGGSLHHPVLLLHLATCRPERLSRLELHQLHSLRGCS